ncbi:MAG: MarR family transcriptional regulator [Ectothiorhodospiraceae bacterium]|nr:MarR family transcriptional regulator [Ectothiorhodospiraceae bacterium]
MNDSLKQSADRLAASIRHLVRATDPDANADGLTPLQWNALHYLALANRLSRTVSGFAAYNGTSKGTASQVIRGLVERGYIRRVASGQDGRSAELVLTDAAKNRLSAAAGTPLTRAIQTLSDEDRTRLQAVMDTLMRRARPPAGRSCLGSCADCAHHKSWRDGGAELARCSREGHLLDQEDLTKICVAYEPR